MNELEINARFNILVNQRNQALDNVVMLGGKVAELEEQVKQLNQEKSDQLVAPVDYKEIKKEIIK